MKQVTTLANRTNQLLFGALILAYVISVAIVIGVRTAPFIGSETDGVYYMLAARSLFTKAFRPPTYGGGVGMPLAIAGVNWIISDTFKAAQLVSALGGLLYLVAAVKIVTKLLSPTLGLLTGLLLLVSPIFLLNCTVSLTDILGASLPLLGLWLLLISSKWSQWPLIVFPAVVFGAAYTVRSINVVFFPLVIIAGLFPRTDAKRRLKTMLTASVGLLVGMLPQLYVNQVFFGNPLYSNNWRNVAALVFDWDYVNKMSSFTEVIKQAGPALFFLWIKRFVVDIPVALYHVCFFLLFFAVPGVALLFRKTDGTKKMLVTFWTISVVLYLLLIASVWEIEPRYFLSALPLVISAALALWQQVTESHRFIFGTGVVIAILMTAFVTVRDGRQWLRRQSVEFKEAGSFLRERRGDEEIILASQPSVFLYANSREGILFENVPEAELSRLDSMVASRQIAWIVFDERRGLQKNPDLSWLLDPVSPEAARLGWRPMFNNGSPRLIVWRTY